MFMKITFSSFLFLLIEDKINKCLLLQANLYPILDLLSSLTILWAILGVPLAIAGHEGNHPSLLWSSERSGYNQTIRWRKYYGISDESSGVPELYNLKLSTYFECGANCSSNLWIDRFFRSFVAMLTDQEQLLQVFSTVWTLKLLIICFVSGVLLNCICWI